jgi:hypothetical protein
MYTTMQQSAPPIPTEYIKRIGYTILGAPSQNLEAVLTDIIGPVSQYPHVLINADIITPVTGSGNLHLTTNQDLVVTNYEGRNGNTNLMYNAPPASNRFSVFAELFYPHGTDVGRWWLNATWIRNTSTGVYQSTGTFNLSRNAAALQVHLTHVGFYGAVNGFSAGSVIQVTGLAS